MTTTKGVSREAITTMVRGALDEAVAAERRSYAVPGVPRDVWLNTIAARWARAFETLLTDALSLVHKHPAWPAMMAVVEETHRPSSYAKDFFYHDRETLEQRQPEVFAWAVRITGTWLFVPGTGPDSCLPLLDAAAQDGQDHHWYWWDGQTLSVVTADTARTRIRQAEREGRDM